jgi:imidazole glycerol-phosphate synthase subunit HisF
VAKKRVIPKLQLMPSVYSEGNMSLVTTVEFDKIIEIGDPVSQAKIYEAQLVDELFFVDLSHSKGEKKGDLLLDILRTTAKEVFLPLTIGGGVKTLEHFRSLLMNGADKISINTVSLENPKIISDAAKVFGSQCVVVSIDYKRDENGLYKVYGKSGTIKYEINPLEWAKQVEILGAGEVLLTCIDNDGKRKGLELEISKLICESLSIPVILSGGCGNASHFIDGFKIAKAEAVSAGTFFCFQDQNPMQTRGHIKNAGIEIRTST